MGNVDKRNRLDEEVFTYSVTKDHKVFIHWLETSQDPVGKEKDHK